MLSLAIPALIALVATAPRLAAAGEICLGYVHTYALPGQGSGGGYQMYDANRDACHEGSYEFPAAIGEHDIQDEFPYELELCGKQISIRHREGTHFAITLDGEETDGEAIWGGTDPNECRRTGGDGCDGATRVAGHWYWENVPGLCE